MWAAPVYALIATIIVDPTPERGRIARQRIQAGVGRGIVGRIRARVAGLRARCSEQQDRGCARLRYVFTKASLSNLADNLMRT